MGDAVWWLDTSVGAEDREDPRRGTDEEDRSTEMHEQEDDRSDGPTDEEQDRPPRAPDSLFERGRDQDESEQVEEDVRLRPMDELERDPGPGRRRQSGGGEQAELHGNR